MLVHPRPQQAFALVGRLLFPTAATPGPMTGETGVSPHAHVDPTAHVEAGAIVEAGAVIGPDVVDRQRHRRSRRTRSSDSPARSAATAMSARAPASSTRSIGNRVIIHGGARIGQDGFGFVAGAKGPERVPQIGRVVIQDDVEIGSNTTVDRGAMSDTVIGQGTKIDNLVQIAHNVRIGRNCIIAGLSGISGSVIVGDNVTHGRRRRPRRSPDHRGRSQACRQKSGSCSNVPAGEIWGGYPAQPMAEAMREIAAVAHAGQGTQAGRRRMADRWRRRRWKRSTYWG